MSKISPRKPTKTETHVELQENNLPQKRRRSFIIHSFLLNVTVWLTFFYYLSVGEEAQPLLIIMYLIYLGEALFAPTLRYLWNLNKVEDIISYIDRLKSYAPEIGFYCECYHMETRTRWVTEYYTEYEQVYDYTSNRYESQPVQKSRQVLETYEEKVVTYTETEYFKFSRFKDTSGDVSKDIYKFHATKVDFSKQWQAGDSATAEAYQSQKNNFQVRNRNRDRYFHFNEFFHIKNFKTKALSIVDLKKKSGLMHWMIYILSSVVILSWIYRNWLERETVKGHFEFRKVIYI